jgi:hemolysin III
MLPDEIAALPKSAGTFARGCLHQDASTMGTKFTWDYDRGETIADAVIHILGIAIAIGGAAVLAIIAVHQGDITELTAIAIYLVALLAMFGFSAAYNLWPMSPLKWWLRRLDHSAIYLLIAATYTAFLLPMRGTAPNVVLIVIWSVAIAGIAIKLLWPGRFDRTAVGLYLSMGWSGIFTIGPITAALAPATLLLIAAGGVLYSVGVIFHAWGSLRFQNAIWHGFVLVAALCHYAAVFTSLVT